MATSLEYCFASAAKRRSSAARARTARARAEQPPPTRVSAASRHNRKSATIEHTSGNARSASSFDAEQRHRRLLDDQKSRRRGLVVSERPRAGAGRSGRETMLFASVASSVQSALRPDVLPDAQRDPGDDERGREQRNCGVCSDPCPSRCRYRIVPPLTILDARRRFRFREWWPRG